MKKPVAGLLEELLLDIRSLTDEEIEDAGRRTLKPLEPSDQVIGTVNWPESKTYWTLAVKFHRMYCAENNDASHLPKDSLERPKLIAIAGRLEAISEVFRTLAWIAIRDEFPLQSYGTGNTLGMCEGWRVVICSPETGKDAALRKIAREGGVVLTVPELLEYMMKEARQGGVALTIPEVFERMMQEARDMGLETEDDEGEQPKPKLQ